MDDDGRMAISHMVFWPGELINLVGRVLKWLLTAGDR